VKKILFRLRLFIRIYSSGWNRQNWQLATSSSFVYGLPEIDLTHR